MTFFANAGVAPYHLQWPQRHQHRLPRDQRAALAFQANLSNASVSHSGCRQRRRRRRRQSTPHSTWQYRAVDAWVAGTRRGSVCHPNKCLRIQLGREAFLIAASAKHLEDKG
ncbi:hypothetical protein R5R35_010552 [Gryllus longicercus]|uniref:Uncharacterized protein n=1 Tax=Gryllus longicercus TaxID=2509291 RepID=A0AAN9Z1P9_9ORTH